jgi:DNA helicase II / ATP-dependent DNA helicase PcrA
MKNEIFESMRWSTPEAISTRRGPRFVRTGEPTNRFWGLWKSNKQALKDNGIEVRPLPEGGWRVRWFGESFESLTVEPSAPVTPVTPAAVHIPTVSSMVWSNEQNAIFEHFRNGQGNLEVLARAGTGKTTTIKQAFSFAPEARMLYAVFNKKNQREAAEKITDPRVDVRTLHSLGYMYIQAVWAGVKPDDSVEDDRIRRANASIPDEVLGVVRRLVAFAKNTTIDPSLAELVEIAEARDLVATGFEEPENGGWSTEVLARVALEVLKFSKERDQEGRISFNDMVWLPVACKWVRAWFDLVCIDECQDMNLPQLTMARLACKPGGRVIVVGDDRQAIYGFRGAVTDGMGMMRAALDAKVLGLTITYRCPKSVVAIASAIVPDYKAADSAPEGIVSDIGIGELVSGLEIGDAVLSRVNAPLMPLCLQTLRRGVSARIEGRDIGQALLSIVKKQKARTIPQFISKIETWGDRMRLRARASKNAEAKIEGINDQVSTLIAVAEGCAGVSEIESRLMNLFQDSEGAKPGVVFSSVHKAKGLEWDRVFILSDTFKRKPGTEEQAREEQNIYYVAVTRAKKHLVMVGK